MKNSWILLFLLMLFVLLASPAAAQVDTLRVNGLNSGVVITTGDLLSWMITLPVGGISDNELWLDLNANGRIDAATDRLLFSFQQRDGRGAMKDAPPDADTTANGRIVCSMPVGLAPARWLFVAKNNGVGDTVDFAVQALTSWQVRVVGRVNGPAGADLQNLVVEAEEMNVPNGAMRAFWEALTNADGTYQIKFPANPRAAYRVRLVGIWGSYLAQQNEFVVMVNETTKTVNFTLMQGAAIRGTVVKGGQVPVEGAKVRAYRWESSGGADAEVQSGPDGGYALVVSPGIYRVTYAKPGFLTAWYPGVDLLQDSDTIHIEPGTLERVLNPVMMEGGAAIRGRVTENGKPLRAEVTAWHRGDFNTTLKYQTWTDDDGTYELYARVELLYVRFMRLDNNDILYNSQTRTPWGAPVTVYYGDVNLDADFGAVPPPAGWKILTGLVTDGVSGPALADVGVGINDAVSPLHRYNLRTGPDGRYTIMVPGGKYFIEYLLPGYQFHAYDHKLTPWSADTLVTNIPGDTIVLPTAQLLRGGLIRGTVTKNGFPVSANVTLFETRDLMQPRYAGHTKPDGSYEVAVAPGVYAVRFLSDMTNENLWYDQKLQPPFDSVVVLTVQDVVNDVNGRFDPIPPPAGFKVITGMVYRFVPGPSSYTMPLEGAFVNVRPLGGMPAPGWHAMTGPDGMYAVLVPEGLYTVMFSKEGFVPVAFDQKYRIGQGDTVRAVGVQDTIKNINARLEPGAEFHGFCSDSSWSYEANPSSIFVFRTTEGGSRELFTGTHTDSTGNYKVLVPPGGYYVKFVRDLDGEVQWYPYHRVLDTAACLITVSSPQDVFEFNAYFSAPIVHGNKMITGRVTETPGEQPLADVQVFVQDEERLNPPLMTSTGSDGTYGILVPQGRYYVWFQKDWHVDLSYASQMGPGGNDVVNASVFAPDTIRDINVQMMLGGKIEGSVKNDVGEPLRARVVLHLANSPESEYLFAYTDPVGHYRIFAPAGIEYYVQFTIDSTGESLWYNQFGYWPADTVKLASTTDVRSNISATFKKRIFWITGLVRSNETELPVAGVTVMARREEYSDKMTSKKLRRTSLPEPGVFTATTDESGRYAMQVGEGSFEVSFHKPGYVSKWWAGENGTTTNAWDYWSLYVGTNDRQDSVGHVNAWFSRGGVIQGRVVKDDQWVSGWVKVYSGTMNDGYMNYQQEYVRYLEPRLAGFYQIAVEPGTYYVQFETDSTSQWKWFDNKRSEPYDPVIVTAIDDTVRGIDVDFTIHDPVEILGVGDVPNDQGKFVFVVWKVNIPEQPVYDAPPNGASSSNPFPVVRFSVWRRDGPKGELTTFMQELPYRGDSILYSVVVPTLADSTGSKGIFWSTYEVTAHSVFSTVLFNSKTARGYSVDNIIPVPPAGVNGAIVGNDFIISWDAPRDNDPVVEYRIYRSTDPHFKPEPANLYRSGVKATSFTDAGAAHGAVYYYAVTAVDDAENEGSPGRLVTNSTVGVFDPDALPTEFALFQNFPNPFNPSTTIAYDLPMERHVTLKVYSMLGQEIATLVDEQKPAGHHSALFDAKRFSSGLYIFKMVAGDFVSIKKMSLVK